MIATNTTVDGKYCFELANNLIHYTSNKNIWTPNNVKRLIISPDMIVLQLHTSPTLLKKVFTPEKYAQCVLSNSYKPMIRVLGGVGNNVCSHVEEIIYCLSSQNGGVLHAKEADLASIVSASKSTNEDQIINTIGERFKRLYAISYYNGTIQNLILNGVPSGSLAKDTYHIADEKALNLRVIPVHTKDWYKGHYFRPAIYPADAEDKSLYKKIVNLELRLAQEELNKQVKDVKDKYLDSIKQKALKETVRLGALTESVIQLCIMLSNQDAVSTLGTYLRQDELVSSSMKNLLKLNDITICDVLDLFQDNRLAKSLRKLGVKFVDNNGSPEDSKRQAEDEVSTLSAISAKLYRSLFNLYHGVLLKLHSKYPITTEVYVSNIDTKITSVGTNQLEAKGIVSLKDAGLSTSVVNICTQISDLFLNDIKCGKYQTVEYWEGIYRKGEERRSEEK